jgi:hypothetical protein
MFKRFLLLHKVDRNRPVTSESKISGDFQAVEKVVLGYPTCLFQEEQIRTR